MKEIITDQNHIIFRCNRCDTEFKSNEYEQDGWDETITEWCPRCTRLVTEKNIINQ